MPSGQQQTEFHLENDFYADFRDCSPAPTTFHINHTFDRYTSACCPPQFVHDTTNKEKLVENLFLNIKERLTFFYLRGNSASS